MPTSRGHQFQTDPGSGWIRIETVSIAKVPPPRAGETHTVWMWADTTRSEWVVPRTVWGSIPSRLETKSIPDRPGLNEIEPRVANATRDPNRQKGGLANVQIRRCREAKRGVWSHDVIGLKGGFGPTTNEIDPRSIPFARN